METDILLKSIHIQTDKECVICYENKVTGFHCTNCFWQHCIDCHAKWIKQSKTCPQCRIELNIDSDEESEDEEEEEEETPFCKKAMYLILIHMIFGFIILYIFFFLVLAGDATIECENDGWCFLTNVMMFIFIVVCSVQFFVKVVMSYQY